MIDYDKYEGHETEHMSVASRKGSWDWVVYLTEDPNIEICQMTHDGIDELNSKGEATAHLFADAPLLLQRCRELERLLETEKEVSADLRMISDELLTENEKLKTRIQNSLELPEQSMGIGTTDLTKAKEG